MAVKSAKEQALQIPNFVTFCIPTSTQQSLAAKYN